MQRLTRIRAKGMLVVALAAALIGGAGGVLAMPLPGSTANQIAADAMLRFEPGDCAWPLPKGQKAGETVKCGSATVPEQHANPTGPTIRLPVAVFKSASANPQPDPIVYIEGGPGGGSETFITDYLPDTLAALTANRDLIVYDQRGTGHATPSLDCPEVDRQELADAAVQLTAKESADHTIAAVLACKDRLVGQGINLGAYNSAEGAADLNDIRAALGYDKLNLFGISYGTRVALTVMRDFPGIVRSATLDSSVPVQANLYEDEASNVNRSLNLLFDACRMDTACDAKYPLLRDDFSATVAQLDAHPLSATVKDRKTKQEVTGPIDGNTLVGMIAQVLYVDQAQKIVPLLIEDLKAGKTAVATIVLNALGVTDDVSVGAHYAIECKEEVPFNSLDKALADAGSVMPELRDSFSESERAIFAICAQWPSGQINQVETQPVSSDLPALVLSSNNDPATPPRYGEETAQPLSHSFLIPFAGVGHSVFGNGGDCAISTIMAFINTPTTKPPTECVPAP
jgi:pimeloyl-ACP methyl ester carboxylesterase